MLPIEKQRGIKHLSETLGNSIPQFLFNKIGNAAVKNVSYFILAPNDDLWSVRDQI